MRSQLAAVAAPKVLDNPSAPLARDAVAAHFVVVAQAEPGLLPRLVEPVAKLGFVPSRVHASREAGDGSEMTVDLRLTDVPARTAELVGMALRAIVGVHRVSAVVEPQH
ncbi:MAG TPA: hypothetical protein PK264_02610 [Hyphomicrobiaceae bacterium]|nr:hypothetical protein [Hyphomicrobiaceae bacterium]